MSKKLNILWGAEQPTRPTGYGVVTRNIAKRLVERGHEVNCIGWDYNGEPFKHTEGWSMIHAGLGGFGEEPVSPSGPSILEYHISTYKPDVYVSLIDPWYIGHAIKSTNALRVPYVAYLPVDGFPISYAWKDILKMVHTPLWMANYGKKIFSEFVQEYSSKGTANDEFKDPVLDRYLEDAGDVLYHGVDTKIFKPRPPSHIENAKKSLNISKFDFIFSSVGKNTFRKQQPRLLNAYKIFLDSLEPHIASRICMFIHCGDPTDTTGMGGWNLPVLCKQMGLEKNVRFTDNGNNPLMGLSSEQMGMLYAVSDVHILATSGEGFGVPSAEAMSSGCAIILPDNSTGPELLGAEPNSANNSEDGVVETDRGWLVKCSEWITGGRWAVNHGIVSVEALAESFKRSFNDVELTRKKGQNARDFALDNLDWDVITDQVESILYKASETKHPLGLNAVRYG